MHYIIDGYNFICSSDLLDLCQGDYARSRDIFEQKVTNYFQAKGKNNQATIVYDGQEMGRDGGLVKNKWLKVIFTLAGEKADDRIIELVESSANPREITVVTNDRSVFMKARCAGALCFSIEEFYQKMEKIARDGE